MVILQAGDEPTRLQSVRAGFDAGIVRHLHPEHAQAGGYMAQDRRGEDGFHRLPSLVAGVLPVRPRQYATVRQLSAALADPRQQAKRLAGSGFCTERRSLAP